MIKLELTQSGGIMGKSLHASAKVDIDEDELLEMLKELERPVDRSMRDGLFHNITINGKQKMRIDAHQAKGKLKKILQGLIRDLKAVDAK
jgi:hypothetical protein